MRSAKPITSAQSGLKTRTERSLGQARLQKKSVGLVAFEDHGDFQFCPAPPTTDFLTSALTVVKMKRKLDDDDGPEGGAKKQLMDTSHEPSTGKFR